MKKTVTAGKAKASTANNENVFDQEENLGVLSDAIKIIGRNANGFIITSTKRSIDKISEDHENDFIFDMLQSEKWRGGAVTEIKKFTIENGVSVIKNIDINGINEFLKMLPTLNKKRHETIVPKEILDSYEKKSDEEGKSARMKTAELISRFVSDDGFINLEEWRNRRLIKMINEAERLSNGITEYLKAVIDHEGNLDVIWLIMPSIHDMIVMYKAWGSQDEEEVYQYYISSDGVEEAIGEWEYYKEEKYRKQQERNDNDKEFQKRMEKHKKESNRMMAKEKKRLEKKKKK